MDQPQVLNTLNAKRHDIEQHIGSLERDLEEARGDLSAILAALKVFSADGPRVTSYMNLARLFPRRELPKLAQAALEAAPDGISTVAIAAHVITVKGLDASDRYLRKALTYKVVQVMRRWEKERKVVRIGKASAAIVWQLSTTFK